MTKVTTNQQVQELKSSAESEFWNHASEITISGVTYVVTCRPSEHAKGTLAEKLEQMILDAAYRLRRELSNE